MKRMVPHGFSTLRSRHRAAVLTAILATALIGISCQKMPLVAPSGSAITLIATTNVLAVNGTTDVTAIILEGAQDAGTGTTAGTVTAGVGTPVHNGTLVTFTTTLGRVEPVEARTEAGRATVKLIADGRSGKATITAFSGAASKTLDVNVGAAGASRVVVTANPQTLPGTGGSTTVSARVEDQQGNGLLGVPVSFSTTAGTLSATSVLTNDQGFASSVLSTNAAATVTASAGGSTAAALSGTVAITIKARTTIAITAPASATVGVPATFTVTPGTGAIISSAAVDFGDGTTAPLGAITAATTLSHVFGTRGIKTIKVTATDSDGGTGEAQTQLAVGALSVTLSASSVSPVVGEVVTFTANVQPTGALTDRYVWNFGDGETGSTGGNQTVHVYSAAGSKSVSVIVTPFNNGEPTVALTSINVKAQ